MPAKENRIRICGRDLCGYDSMGKCEGAIILGLSKQPVPIRRGIPCICGLSIDGKIIPPPEPEYVFDTNYVQIMALEEVANHPPTDRELLATVGGGFREDWSLYDSRDNLGSSNPTLAQTPA